MTGKRRPGNPLAVNDIASGIVDPLLRRRTGISVGLVQSWDEIVGERLAAMTRPEKIQWPRRDEEDAYEPATLVVACSGAAALRVQHETDQIVQRVNSFLGFAAVGRVKIVQKHIEARQPRRPKLRDLSEQEKRAVEARTAVIEDEGLRAALERLGKSVAAARK